MAKKKRIDPVEYLGEKLDAMVLHHDVRSYAEAKIKGANYGKTS